MTTQNINVAPAESTETWVKKIRRILDRAHYHVACNEEAHAHYGDKFSRFDACFYFAQGMATAIKMKFANRRTIESTTDANGCYEKRCKKNKTIASAKLKWSESFEILVAEGVKGTEASEYEVYVFHTLTALQKFRKSFPEEMKMDYSYMLSAGTKPGGEQIPVCSADHFKAFVKLVKASVSEPETLAVQGVR